MFEINNKSWEDHLQKVIRKPDHRKLFQFLEKEYALFPKSTFPSKNNLFRAFELTNLDKLKVVILGQDPYPSKGHAHGLCFSCDISIKPLPKSLQNIFKEYESDLNQPSPLHGDLSNWAQQGVLLLNAILSVHEGQPLSHAKMGWEEFTDEIIQIINEECENVIFVLWGKPAQEKGLTIDKTKHVILKAPHPSPLSAYRGFFGSKPFTTINQKLKETGKEPINW